MPSIICRNILGLVKLRFSQIWNTYYLTF
jgi:hypothetical protein